MVKGLGEFLAEIAIIVALYPLCVEKYNKCKVVADSYNFAKKNSFVLNFFEPIKPDSKSMQDFVCSFNNTVLDLHIEIKDAGGFVPTSAISIQKDSSCSCCGYLEFIDCDGSVQCDGCGAISRNQTASAWSDISRVHTAPTYCYDRKNQFKECLLQYQGKCDINFKQGKYGKSGQLIAKKISCPKMSKLDFLQLLKTEYKSKFHNDQFHMIYYNTMGIEPPDLSIIENDVLNDFDLFVKTYSKYKRSISGVSNCFIMYQLLNRHGHYATKDDVCLSSSIDSASERACIMTFRTLKWKMY
jgi:hypothetical protein